MSRTVRKKKTTRNRLILLLLMIAVAVAIFTINPGGGRDDGVHVVGYLPSWYYGCYKDIDYDVLTDLSIAFVNPDSAGNMSLGIADETLKSIVKKAHRNHVRVIASLGGGNGYANYTSLTSDKKSIKEFDSKIIEYLKAHDFDGVDINIEGDVEPEFWDNYDMWIKDLAKKCRKEKFSISCAIASWFDDYISDETLDRFDYISVMAYDNKSSAENPSTYNYAVGMIEHFAEDRNVDKDKLLVGIPFYGYRYRNNICTGEVVTFHEIATYNKDSEKSDASGTCRYNGIDTVKAKTQLGLEYGGVMVWALGQDASGKKSLLRAIGEEL